MRWRTLHAVGGLASAVLAGLAGCSNEEPEYEKDEGSYQDSGTPPQGTDQNSGDQGLAEVVLLMERECALCHSSEPDEYAIENYAMGPAPMLLTADVFCDVVATDSLVLPGDPDRGLLYARLTNIESPMPPSGNLGDADILLVKTWIDAGAFCASSPGAQAFRQTCAGCHGNEGEGSSAPRLSQVLPGMSEDDVTSVILEGSGGMAALVMEPDLAAEVATYVWNAWGDGAGGR